MGSASTARIVSNVLRQCPEARATLLYGSAARGEATEKSDVDVLVITAEPCRVELGPPYSVLVVTLEEWLKAPARFRAEVLREAVVLYASRLRIRDLVAGEPWLLLRYTASSPSSRACASRIVAGLEKKGFVERVAPGVVLVPLKAAERLIEALEACGARLAASKIVLHRVATMYCGRCPYCGLGIVETDYGEARRKLREHILAAHRERLEEQAERLRMEGKGLPGGSLRGLAGYIASTVIHEC